MPERLAFPQRASAQRLPASRTRSPLYGTYRALWGFSRVVLTLVYAAYAVGALASLLLAGRTSDETGRRTVLIVALGALMLSTVVFMAASSVAWLFGRTSDPWGRDGACPRSGKRRVARLSSAPRRRRSRFGQRGAQHRRDRVRSAYLGVDCRVAARPQGASLRRRPAFMLAALSVLSSWSIMGLFLSLPLVGPCCSRCLAIAARSDVATRGVPVGANAAGNRISALRIFPAWPRYAAAPRFSTVAASCGTDATLINGKFAPPTSSKA